MEQGLYLIAGKHLDNSTWKEVGTSYLQSPNSDEGKS